MEALWVFAGAFFIFLLHLLIEAKSQKTIDLAKAELKRALMEIKSEIDPRTLQSFGRYSVM